jgi:hypothetical protein
MNEEKRSIPPETEHLIRVLELMGVLSNAQLQFVRDCCAETPSDEVVPS